MTFFITAVTFLFPVIMLPINLCLFTVQRRHGTLYSFLIAFGMAAIAFNFAPFDYQNTDILRHFDRLRSIKNVSFQQALVNDAYSSLMGYYLILKVFSMVENPSLLPAFITFLGYFVCLYVISQMDREKNSAIRFITLFLFMSCTSFLGFCSGIRQYLIFSCFSFIFYSETVQKKNKVLPWVMYLLLITIHTTMIIILILRLICGLLCKKEKLSLLGLLVFFWSFIQSFAVRFIANNFNNKYTDKILEMYGYYENHDSNMVVPNFLWRTVLLIFCTIVVLTLINCKDGISRSLKKYLCFCMILCAFTLGSIMQYDIFVRFCMLSFIMILPLLPTYFSKLNKTTGLFMLGACTLGGVTVLAYNISQYLSFHWNGAFDIITTNIFTFIFSL